LDCSNFTSSSYDRIGILFASSGYWHIKGIEVRNCNQYSGSPAYGGQGIYISGSSYITIENCASHNNGGPGMGKNMAMILNLMMVLHEDLHITALHITTEQEDFLKSQLM
jgi:hypothetical protein